MGYVEVLVVIGLLVVVPACLAGGYEDDYYYHDDPYGEYYDYDYDYASYESAGRASYRNPIISGPPLGIGKHGRGYGGGGGRRVDGSFGRPKVSPSPIRGPVTISKPGKVPLPKTQACKNGQVLQVDGTCHYPIVHRKVFIYAAPATPLPNVRPPKLPKPEVLHNVVFIRAPEPQKDPEPIVIPPPRSDNVVYVLNKLEDKEQKVVKVPTPPQEAPQVYFINYKDGDDLLQKGVGIGALGAVEGSQDELAAGVGGVKLLGKVDGEADYNEQFNVAKGNHATDTAYDAKQAPDTSYGVKHVPDTTYGVQQLSETTYEVKDVPDITYAGKDEPEQTYVTKGVPDLSYAGTSPEDAVLKVEEQTDIEALKALDGPHSVFVKA